jgi:four helix bundle protein
VFRSKSTVHRCSFRRSNSTCWRIKIRRASKSICANIAEGFGKQRRSKAEFKRYLLMAIGSAEMQVWLRYSSDLRYIDQETCAMWRDEYRQIAKMLQGLYSTMGMSSDH